MRGNAQRHAPRAPTRLEKLTALKLFLYRCQYQILECSTIDQLIARHGCDRKATEYERQIALQKRAGEA